MQIYLCVYVCAYESHFVFPQIQFVFIIVFVTVLVPLSGCNMVITSKFMDFIFGPIFLYLFYAFYRTTFLARQKNVAEVKNDWGRLGITASPGSWPHAMPLLNRKTGLFTAEFFGRYVLDSICAVVARESRIQNTGGIVQWLGTMAKNTHQCDYFSSCLYLISCCIHFSQTNALGSKVWNITTKDMTKSKKCKKFYPSNCSKIAGVKIWRNNFINTFITKKNQKFKAKLRLLIISVRHHLSIFNCR